MAESPAPTSNDEPSRVELLGSNHWQDLLNPLHLSLRHLILLSGDLTQVTYDTFNDDEFSEYSGTSRYGPRNILHRTYFPSASDFTVPAFIYATSSIDLPASFLLFSLSREGWSKESNWMGYVAVSSDARAKATGHREIYVAWRGTIRDFEWVDVLQPELVDIQPILRHATRDHKEEEEEEDDDDHHPKVMQGWYTIYTSSDSKSPFCKASARSQLLSTIMRLVQTYKEESLSIVCVGHSLGACLAILSAFDIVENGLSKVGDKPEFPVCAVVFGSPQVGNKAFNDRLEKLPGLRVLHVKNALDVIPLYPTGLLGFVNTGVELVIDNRKSPYLKDTIDPAYWHGLQGILHTVAGWNGEEGEFDLRAKRSLALVNKYTDYLKEEYLVPESWWAIENKGMVLGEDGEWRQAQPTDDDIPVPPSLDDIDMSFNTPLVKQVSTTTTKKMKKKNGFGFLHLCPHISCFGISS